MSEEENRSTEIFAAGKSNTADDTRKKLSADASGLGSSQKWKELPYRTKGRKRIRRAI